MNQNSDNLRKEGHARHAVEVMADSSHVKLNDMNVSCLSKMQIFGK